ncbi:MAG: glucosyltransferase domain-containing protein [Clostridia bacterium]
MNTKIKKEDLVLFIILFIIMLLIFKEFVCMHYATDTYNIFARGYKEYAILYSLNDGRVFMSGISLLADAFNIPINVYIITLTILAIATSCISIIVLKNIIERYKKPSNKFEKIILILICFCTIFNFTFIENMQFAECFVMSLSILCYLLAADVLAKNNSHYIVKAFLLVLIGIFSYQGTLGFFVVMTFIISITENKKTAFKKILISGIICLGAVLINLIEIKTCGYLLGNQSARMGGIKNIKYMISRIIKVIIPILKDPIGTFPKYEFILIFLLTILFVNIKTNKKERTYLNCCIALLTILTLITAFAINLFTIAGFYTARMLFVIGALMGNIFTLIYLNTNILENKTNIINCIIIIYCISIVCCYISLLKMHKKVELYTQEECKTINEYITDYEKQTGNTIENIAVYNDKSPTYYYYSIKNYSALMIRPLAVEWGDNGAISFWTKRTLKEVEPNIEIYEKNFKNKDWNILNKEQFVFEENTMHYCIY